MANSVEDFTDFTPGRVRGEWVHDTLYLTGDLICFWQSDKEHFEHGRYLWFVARQTHRSGENSSPSNASSEFWQLSHWANISEEFTLPEKIPNVLSGNSEQNNLYSNTHTNIEQRFQRVHSVNPEMVDAFILGKGVPSWYYYDLMGFFNTRSNILRPLELLTTMRGTITGLNAWLNLINLDGAVARIVPEEYYEVLSDDGTKKQSPYDEYYLPDYNGFIQRTENDLWLTRVRTILGIPEGDTNAILPNARVWSDEIDFKLGDYVYVNRYTKQSGYFSTDRHAGLDDSPTYCGCDLYQALDNIKREEHEDKGIPSEGSNENWKWIASYKIKDIIYNTKQDRETASDNSYYRVEISQVSKAGTELINNRLAILDEKRQSMLTCYLKRLMEFLIPAWIRFESGLLIADKRSLNTLSAAHSLSSIFSDTVGPEPYTLTIYPYVGFDPQDVNWVKNCELSHTEAWRTDVLHISDSPILEVEDIWSSEKKISWEKIIEWDVKLLDNLNPLEAYMWREDYMRLDDRSLIKVRLLSSVKLKLRSWNIYDVEKISEWQ